MNSQKVRLVYPAHVRVRPEDTLAFVEADGFLGDWTELGLNDDDLFRLQMILIENPRQWPILSKTGGLREGRFLPEHWAEDRELTVRYVYFADWHCVLLVIAFEGDAPLTLVEAVQINNLIQREQRVFSRRTVRVLDR